MKINKFFNFVGILTLSSISLVGLVNCGNQENENNFIDYVTTDENIRLKNDYKNEDGSNKDFFTQGIGQVTPQYYIDGDTVHFTLDDSSNRELIKARFYGVDTPESTGAVEPWGKAASDFTKKTISNAYENGTVVISSLSITEDKAPSFDSNGRYLCLIWVNETVKDADYDQLYLLNLMLVQNGYSQTEKLDEFPEFKETFLAAEAQARDNKLVMFSGKDDPDYNYGDYQDVSLVDLKNEVVKTLEDPTYVNKYENAKVRIRGTVAGFTNHILYLQVAIEDEDTGKIEYAGINIFTGMQAIPQKYTARNTFIQLCGLAQTSENFGFQITDVYSFPRLSPENQNDTTILYSPDEIPEEYQINDRLTSVNDLDKNYDYLFNGVELEEDIYITNGYDSNSTPTNVTLYGNIGSASGEKSPINIYVPFLYTPDESKPLEKYNTYTDYVGKTYHVKGIYSFHKQADGDISYQIILRDSNDLVLVE